MFPKRKLVIIIWKLCQVSSRNRKPSPHSNAGWWTGFDLSEVQSRIATCRGLESCRMKEKAHAHFNR
jgi:hypothetical protein